MRFLGWTVALMLAGWLSAHALSVSPTRIVVSDDGGTQVAIRLEAESASVPIEVTIVERLPGGVFAPAPASVIRAHPPQLLLYAAQPRPIQIEISSGIAVEQGRSFYIRIEQLALRSAGNGSEDDQEIVLLATYLLPIHVLGGHAGTLNAALKPAATGEQLVLTNAGKGPALLSGCRLTFEGQTGPGAEIEGRRIAEQIGSDSILPGETVTLDLISLLSGTHFHSGAILVGAHTACDPPG